MLAAHTTYLMTALPQFIDELRARPRRWLITGVAGFIGSNLLETLLQLDQQVIGVDNFATGTAANLQQVRDGVTATQWSGFEMIEGSIADPRICHRASQGVNLVLHEAALGSVPLSIEEPAAAHEANVTGFLNVLIAARDAGVQRVIYASSSAVYGDDPELPKVETKIGRPLSPYAATKLMGEIYAGTFAQNYGLASVGLRYFNVFGPRQDPNGAYAAVIPKWIDALLRHEPVQIHGDGETSRDFCHVDNVVQANLCAALTELPAALNQVYNIALGERTTLNELFTRLHVSLSRRQPALPDCRPIHGPERPGDIRHSLADIRKARELLGYAPGVNVADGLERAMDWYCSKLR
jgi:UDP-N-acetylglucosamine 4-epimerase